MLTSIWYYHKRIGYGVERVTIKQIIRATAVSVVVAAFSMLLLLWVVNQKYGVQAPTGNSYVAGMSVFLFGVALVAALLGSAGGELSSGASTGETGVVKWFNTAKGFGFITLDEGSDVFVHYRDILGKGHRSLSAGQKVTFKVTHGKKGPQAQDVTVLS